jgi:hypothetical protein
LFFDPSTLSWHDHLYYHYFELLKIYLRGCLKRCAMVRVNTIRVDSVEVKINFRNVSIQKQLLNYMLRSRQRQLFAYSHQKRDYGGYTTSLRIEMVYYTLLSRRGTNHSVLARSLSLFWSHSGKQRGVMTEVEYLPRTNPSSEQIEIQGGEERAAMMACRKWHPATAFR